MAVVNRLSREKPADRRNEGLLELDAVTAPVVLGPWTAVAGELDARSWWPFELEIHGYVCA